MTGAERLAREIIAENDNIVAGIVARRQHPYARLTPTKGGLREAVSRLRGMICGYMMAVDGWVLPDDDLAWMVNDFANGKFGIDLVSLYRDSVA